NDEVGAVNFTLAHGAQEVEVAGEVSRIFLGVQIQCAQCHDHPNDPWKRQQFHEFAAFFAGARARRASPPDVRPEVYEVVAEGTPHYAMPDLKDPRTQIPVRPRFFLADATAPIPDGLTAGQRRALAASFVTGQDNPWFAKAFVTRVLYALMGESFYNPIDDLGPTRAAKAPEVLETLAAQWRRGGHDVRWLFRTILNTRTYQRASRSTRSEVGRAAFASNCAGRLRADQIADALAQALNLPLAPPQAQAAEAKSAKAPASNPRRTAFVSLFGVDPSLPNEDVIGTIPQALYLMNDAQLNGAIRADKGKVLGEILAQTKDNRVALEALYLRVLCRRPSPAEVEVCSRYLALVRDRRQVFEDILWSLVNSTEFVSRR
ncbi:MAG TPA: DUF1553 domain-containing protein, partial [Isosphaeraceae bacterium]